MFAEGRDAKPIREFREDTGEVSVPGESPKQQQQGAPLYADQVAKVRYDNDYLLIGAHNAVTTCLRGQQHQSGSACCFTCVLPWLVLLQAEKKLGDNLSKDMKQKLRQEYYGLGGAENKVRVRHCCCRLVG